MTISETVPREVAKTLRYERAEMSESEQFRPPDGVNFSSNGNLPITDVSTALCRIASFLQNDALPNQLLRYEDWWEHDGLHFEQGTLDIHGLIRLVESGRSILEATPDDEYVCVGIAPIEQHWYLRFRGEWDDTGSSVVGSFDLTLPEVLCDSFRNDVVSDIQFELTEEPAHAYFARIMR